MTCLCEISGFRRRRIPVAQSLMVLLVVFMFFSSVRTAAAKTSVYIFDPNHSTVTRSGGFIGIPVTYSIAGRFQLNVDGKGKAVFEKVEADLTDEAGTVYSQSLNDVFNMDGLSGDPIDTNTIIFKGKTADGTDSDVYMELALQDGRARLTGQTTPPPNSADMFTYSIDATASRKYASGTGEPNAPYLIYTSEQMNAIGAEPNDWDSHFKLMADIDLSGYKGTDFNIIGYWHDWDDNKPFTGAFDGAGHKISNFSYTSIDSHYIGLFGYVDLQSNKGEIRNLGLLDSIVNAGAGECIGTLVGSLKDGIITNCYCEGGTVSGDNKVGGLLGDNGGTITNCYASCSVTGNFTVGGLLGMNSGHIVTCYSTSSVSGGKNIGGLAGLESGGTTKDSFWNIETGGPAASDDGMGRTTAEMQTLSTFTDAGWDFVGESANGTEDIWSICEGTNYPRLVWQIPAGDFVCPDGITTEDFLFFLDHWLDDNCDFTNAFCQGTDLDLSGKVDQADLEIFLESWLADTSN